MKKVYFLRSNGVSPDPRVEKEVKALVAQGYHAHVLCWDRTAILPKEDKIEFDDKLSAGVTRFSLASGFGLGLKNLLPLLRFQFFLLNKLIRSRKEIDIIHAADFDTVLPAMVMKLFFRKKVVYDIYDFYVDAYNVPSALKPIVRRIDVAMINQADVVILTTEKRINQIAGSHPKRIVFLHNTPEYTEGTEKMTSARCEDHIVVSYVGVLQPGRLIEVVLSVIARHPNVVLKIAGFGPLESVVRSYAEKFENVHFFGAVSYEQSIEISRSSDIMFATYDPSIPNHKYSSPNKLYEAMMLSKPIIICHETGVDEIVETKKLGLCIDYDEASFERALLTLVDNKELRQTMALNAHMAYQDEFSWEKMKLRLLDAYRCLSKLA